MMILMENLIRDLEKAVRLSRGNGISNWLVSCIESRFVSAGLKGLEIGNAYSPTRSGHSMRGEIIVHWRDGLFSRSSISRTMLESPKLLLNQLREIAFFDPFAPLIPEQQKPTGIPVLSPSIENIVLQDPSILFSFLGLAANAFKSLNTKNCQATATAIINDHHLASGNGLNCRFTSTTASFEATADSLYTVETSSREMIGSERISQRLGHLEDIVRVLRNRQTSPSDVSTVVFLPPLALRFVSHFLLSNLDAERIFEGRSAFQLEKIDSDKPLFHTSFGLCHNPCRPMHSASFPMDSQGLASRTVQLIDGGTIRNVAVTLRGARQTGWKPNPSVKKEALIPTGGSTMDLFQFLEDTDSAFVAGSVLGLHTQDPGRGDYSVAVPHGILICGGKMTGVVKGLLNGNFFKNLQEPVTLLTSPFHEFQGLAFRQRVHF